MLRMGRPRSSRKDLPPGLYFNARKGFYYYRPATGLRPSAYTHIGHVEREAAIRRWVVLSGAVEQGEGGTVGELLDRYLRDGLPKKADRTQREYTRQAAKLRAAFGALRYARSEADAARGGVVRRMDIVRYLRAASAPVQANRDISLLSEVFEIGRDCGLTEYNPCAGAPRNRERPRRRFVAWQEYAKLRHAAPPVIRLAMLLTRLTGMREGDLLRLRWSDVSDRGVRVIHGKTGFDQGLHLSWGLSLALGAARHLRGNLRSLYVLHTRKGQPYTISGFQSMWQRTVARSGVPDVHFHDLRARAVTDAENRRGDGANLAGHTDARTTRRIYLRGPRRVRPVR